MDREQIDHTTSGSSHAFVDCQSNPYPRRNGDAFAKNRVVDSVPFTYVQIDTKHDRFTISQKASKIWNRLCDDNTTERQLSVRTLICVVPKTHTSALTSVCL